MTTMEVILNRMADKDQIPTTTAKIANSMISLVNINMMAEPIGFNNLGTTKSAAISKLFAPKA